MSLKCLVGLHKPINDFSSWENGRNVSACASCGVAMTKRRGARWQAAPRSGR